MVPAGVLWQGFGQGFLIKQDQRQDRKPGDGPEREGEILQLWIVV